MFRFCFYISGHGFGHAARDVEIVNALVRREPSLRLLVRTQVPEWFLARSLERAVERVDGETDSGVVQPDSLSIDEDETARRASAFYREFDARVDAERALLRRLEIDLVAGDIPPLAFAAAAAAGVPSVAVGNFTWDWIYGAYPQFDTIAPGVRRLIADADAQATLALRMPFWGGFERMNVEDVPLVARHATRDPEETRRRLSLHDDRPIVLATFGGHGSSVPLERAAADGRFTLVATDYEAGGVAPPPSLRVIRHDELRHAGVTYTDLLAACDLVVTKLGYGIVSECIANGVALLYAPRGRFREQEVFERELPRVMRCAPIARGQLMAGEWSGAIDRLLSRPAPAARMASNGAEVVAERIVSRWAV